MIYGFRFDTGDTGTEFGFVLADDADQAKEVLADEGLATAEIENAENMLYEQYRGLAFLATLSISTRAEMARILEKADSFVGHPPETTQLLSRLPRVNRGL